MFHRHAVAAVAASVTLSATAAGTASAATMPVACGTPALVTAINQANSTVEADTLSLANGCTYNVTTASFVGNPAGNNVGLPLITRPLTIAGNGATIVRPTTGPNPATQSFRMLFVLSGIGGTTGSLTIQDLILFGGRLTAAGQHGAVIGALASDVVIRRSLVGFGQTTGGNGGAFALTGGSLRIEDSTVGTNGAVAGGAIYTVGANVAIERSTLANNGAVSNSGTMQQNGGTSTIVNSTISGNGTLNTNNVTGGIAVGGCAAATCGTFQPGTATVRSSTFADNGVLGDPKPGLALTAFTNGASITVEDTIVGDTDSTEAKPGCLTAAGASIVNAGGNLEWPATSCGFATNADPKLAALANNGGPTQTHKLQPGSPALELGGQSCPPVDQRNLPRPGGDACDAGAYEADPPETTASGPDGTTNEPIVTFGADESPVSFECSIDGGEWSTCTSPFAPDLDDGEHTIRVRAIDADGYGDPSPASVTFVVDRTPPDTTITSGPSGTVYDQDPTFAFTASEAGSTFECRMDGGAWTACTSPKTYAGLPAGSHTFAVRAIDPYGNADPTPASRTFTLRRCTLTRLTLGLLGQPVVVCV